VALCDNHCSQPDTIITNYAIGNNSVFHTYDIWFIACPTNSNVADPDDLCPDPAKCKLCNTGNLYLFCAQK
jgi:hypothetical protein